MFLWKYDGCGLSPIADILIVPPHGQLHGVAANRHVITCFSGLRLGVLIHT